MLFGKLFTNPKMWVNGDADEITMGGVYTCKDVQNVPTGDGALLVFKTENTVKQVFVPVGEEGVVYTRVLGEEWTSVTGTSEETEALIQSAIDKANQAQAKADTVDTRLNNIIVESGTSDAEVVAARTDSSGQTFTTLGQRLDTQFGEIKEDLDESVHDLKSALTEYTGNAEIPVTVGGYIATNGTGSATFNVNPDADWAYCRTPCVAGDIFTITGTGSSAPRLWAFIDSNLNILVKAQRNASLNGGTIVAPTGAAELIVNVKITNAYKNVIKGKPVVNVTNEIGERTSEIENAIFDRFVHSLSDSTELSGKYIRPEGSIGSSTGNSVGYFRCLPNMKYTLRTTVTNDNTAIGYTTTTPAQDVSVYGVSINNGGYELSITTGQNAVFLVFAYDSTDTGVTVEVVYDAYAVNVHFEKGKYDGTVHRYGGPLSNWPGNMINKYPIVLNGAYGVIIPALSFTSGTGEVIFRNSSGTTVSSRTFSCDEIEHQILVPANSYYMDIEIPYSGLKDITVKFISDSGISPVETKRIYINSNNSTVNYFQVDYENDLYSGMCYMIPPNYTPTGEKVPLVLWFDGNGNYHRMGSSFSQAKLPGLTYVRDEGYAILQVFSWGSYLAGKYADCGDDQPYPTPTCFKCIKAGLEYFIDRYNIDGNNVHIASKSMGGLISLYFASHPIYDFKSIGMFAPILDMFGLRGRFKDARKALAEDMAFSGNHVTDFFDISMDGSTDTGVPNYYFSERCQPLWLDNMGALAQINPAYAMLVGGTLLENYQSSLTDARKWYADMTDNTIYQHTEYQKMGHGIPVKIWGAEDDDNVPYLAMPEIVNQLLNGGTQAEIKTVATGGHSCFDVDTTYAEDVTTVLGIVHNDVPLGWVELVQWIRKNSYKYDMT